MKLLSEHIDESLTYIVEATESGEKNVYIEGIYMQAEQLNKNLRIYPRGILKESVSKFVSEKVSPGRAVGELDHPKGPKINMDRVSHRITSLEWKGNDVIGKALVLDTPMGQIVKGLIKGGVQLGVSSRGMGTVVENKQKGTSTITEDFILSTIDIVQDPSAPSAFVNGIMEGVEWIWNNGLLTAQQLENYEKVVHKASLKDIAVIQERVFADFLTRII